jgi:hypothetical protein
MLPHILIALDAPRLEVGIAVVVARRNAVPRLTRVLEVADVLIRQLEAVAEPSQSAVSSSPNFIPSVTESRMIVNTMNIMNRASTVHT